MGLYYLNSRYYDPEIGRFISPDIYLSTGQGFTGDNMFAYCLDDPVNMKDDVGTLLFFVVTATIGCVLGGVIGGVVAAKNNGNIWAGININNPIYGSWVDKAHQSWSREYNEAWEKFFNTVPNPTINQIYRKATELANKYGFTLNFK